MKKTYLNRYITILSIGFLILISACSQPAYIQRNNLLVADGQLDDAVADYRNLIAEDPENPELYYQLAKVLYLKKAYGEAVQPIEKAIIIDHLIDRYQLLAGKIKFAASDYFEAIDHLTNALILNPQYLEAYYFLGLAHYQTGQTEKALAQLQSAISLEPLYFEAQLAWAKIRFQQLIGSTPGQTANQSTAQPESTIKAFLLLTETLEKALNIKPESVPGHLLLSDIYTTLGADFKARSLLEKRLDEFGPDDRILLALAEIEYRRGRYDKARQILAKQTEKDLPSRILRLKIEIKSPSAPEISGEITKMVRQNPESEELLLLSARWMLKQGSLSDAERQVQKSLEINPDFAEAYFVLSEIHEAQNDPTGAQWSLRKALLLAPANLEIRLAYLHSLLDQGNWYEAENQLKQYALDDDHPEVIYLKGIIAMEKGDDNLAEKLFLDAAKKRYSVETETRLAEIEIERGQFRSAETRLQRIAQIFPENVDIAIVRANLLMRTDRSSEVSPLLTPYLSNKQSRGRVHLLLAESLVQRGETNAALTTLAKALERWPRTPELVQAYTLLLGLSNRYQEAIPLLEEMQTFAHPFSQLFYFRLRTFYFKAGQLEKFKSYQRRYQLEKNRVRRLF